MRGIRSYTYTNGDCYTDAYRYGYSYGHAYTYTNAIPMLGAVYTDAATSPHTAGVRGTVCLVKPWQRQKIYVAKPLLPVVSYL